MSENTIIKDLKKLISYQTVNANLVEIDRCYDYLLSRLSSYPLLVSNYCFKGVRSIVWSTHKTKHPKIILNAHIDVVPGELNQYSPKIVKNKLYGRGSSDMKFALAVFIDIINLLHKKYTLPSIALMVTSDEETGGINGTNYLLNKIGYRCDLAIIPDGGDNFNLVEKAKGVLHLRIISKGKTAHASRPWEGKNSIDIMVKAINKMRNYIPESTQLTWTNTLNLGIIHGGKQTNQVPDITELTIDIRYIPGNDSKKILNTIRDIALDCNVEILVEAPPFSVDRDNKYIVKWLKILKKYNHTCSLINENGASDGRYFSDLKIPTILSKPIGGNIHAENEWIDIPSIYQYNELLLNYLLDIGYN